ncbi:uncharacterized protein L969DRAFT_87362 [Mixia osmundae IAM 14324]|uniref:uncharacterized protein n=1 Tax=Mixia osmundae (strain CBS 9802 / IAM 14324 / JCM 22182 / KY 12970) TaxID=764103 RepID=UPI0004A55829|nr:uncharacterized protein L969DRAFT_87362 [Mixia osmundae IAM 14324]KEI39403.1 hypothetical protein L969DRAFT_87362 [Mixia osmundae IAM 14324]
MFDAPAIDGVKTQNPFPVQPTGLLLGSMAAAVLYGLHIGQVHRYYTRFRESDSAVYHCFVAWVFCLSSLQMAVCVSSLYHYLVSGIGRTEVYDYMWYMISVQDGLIPTMAVTAHAFFGYRVYVLTERRRWIAILLGIMAPFTWCVGITLAVTCAIWAHDPVVPLAEFRARKIGLPAQVVSISWLGLSASIDAFITIALVATLLRKRTESSSTRRTLRRIAALTMETVALTHAVGATMCLLFLVAPAAHRTQSNVFWFLLELVTELYALSILFTLNSRRRFRRVWEGERWLEKQMTGAHGNIGSSLDSQSPQDQSIALARINLDSEISLRPEHPPRASSSRYRPPSSLSDSPLPSPISPSPLGQTINLPQITPPAAVLSPESLDAETDVFAMLSEGPPQRPTLPSRWSRRSRSSNSSTTQKLITPLQGRSSEEIVVRLYNPILCNSADT